MKKRLSPSDVRNGIIDIHTHSGGIDSSRLLHLRYPTCQSILDLNQKRISSCVDYMVTFPMPNTLYFNTAHYWNTGQFIPSGFCDFPFQYENELLLKEISYFNLDHILPFMSFSLRDNIAKQQERIYSLAENYSIYGLKYHTVTDQKHFTAIENESDFLSLAKDLDIPIMVHSDATGFGDSLKILDLAARYPDIRFCAAHFGGFSRHLFDALSDYPYDNLFVDTAPVSVLCKVRDGKHSDDRVDIPFNQPDFVFNYYLEHFPDRMIWGSDEPWTIISSFDNTTHTPPMQYGYQREVDLLINSGKTNFTTINAIRFLFGI